MVMHEMKTKVLSPVKSYYCITAVGYFGKRAVFVTVLISTRKEVVDADLSEMCD